MWLSLKLRSPGFPSPHAREGGVGSRNRASGSSRLGKTTAAFAVCTATPTPALPPQLTGPSACVGRGKNIVLAARGAFT
jgi:hypothetical protein